MKKLFLLMICFSLCVAKVYSQEHAIRTSTKDGIPMIEFCIDGELPEKGRESLLIVSNYFSRLLKGDINPVKHVKISVHPGMGSTAALVGFGQDGKGLTTFAAALLGVCIDLNKNSYVHLQFESKMFENGPLLPLRQLPEMNISLSNYNIVPTILHEFLHLLGISTNKLPLTTFGVTSYYIAGLTPRPLQHFIEERLDSLLMVQDVREEIFKRLITFSMNKKDNPERFEIFRKFFEGDQALQIQGDEESLFLSFDLSRIARGVSITKREAIGFLNFKSINKKQSPKLAVFADTCAKEVSEKLILITETSVSSLF
jgi:hypothetical protein